MVAFMGLSTLRLCFLLLLGAVAPLGAAASAPLPARVNVSPMKTSIYVGSVRLTAGPFVRDGERFSTTYEAKVVPWFFWSETGQITIKLPLAELTRLASGQTVEFTGEAANHKNKPRQVTGRAQPADAVSGKIKVRILADGYELIFNGSYRFESTPQPLPAKP